MASTPGSPESPTPPREPALEECCGSGCTPCIFDLYEQAKERYEADLAASRAAVPTERNPQAGGGGRA